MIPALLLVLSVAAYRIASGLLIHSGATWLSNFTPLAAIALFSAAYFPGKYKFSVPLVTLFISDAVINFHYGAPLLDGQILVRYVALAGVGFVGLLLQTHASLKTLLPASPSWMFFRNSVISDCLFMLLFIVCFNIGRSAEGSRARAAVPRTA